jgi:geranylgeranyl pyrophosphate synthase
MKARDVGVRWQMEFAESIRAHVLAVPEVASWPDIAALFERAASKPRPDWEWPVLACRAVGSDPSLAVPGAAAIGCLYVSIILVDDMLDEDPRGEHLRRGCGPTANIALALQAAAFRVIDQAVVSAERRAAVTSSLAWLALATCWGQDLDAQNLEGEDNYWKVVRAKSTPFYGTALHVGALLGNAPLEVAAALRDLGLLLGEVIQIQDDLMDTFQVPAAPDWTRGRLSLPILYASSADHPDRARFMELLPQANDPGALREAQRILLRCGAVSYCAYQMLQRQRQVRQMIDGLSLADPAPIRNLWTEQIQPLIRLLSTRLGPGSGDEPIPAELMALME